MANTVVTMKVRTSTTGIKVTKDILLILETKYVTSPEPKFIEQQKILMTSVLLFTSRYRCLVKMMSDSSTNRQWPD